jgi:predicted acyl esterase
MRPLRAALFIAPVLAAATLVAAPVGAAPAVGTGTAIPADVIKASAAPGSKWQPGPARYSVGKSLDRAVTMKDGTVLRADVYYPIDSSGKAAKGPFPVLLTMTPYGKGIAGAASGAGGQTGPNDYFVQRGYIDVVADVRGTGDSEGSSAYSIRYRTPTA